MKMSSGIIPSEGREWATPYTANWRGLNAPWDKDSSSIKFQRLLVGRMSG
jgi:hypothetical protein